MNNAKKSLVPHRRFKEFQNAGAWEQRKFMDLIDSIIDFRGRTPKKLGMNWSNEGLLALSAQNVKDGYIDKTIDAHYGSQTLYDKWMNGRELHKGQVVFTTEAPMGNVARIPDENKYILSQRTIAFTVKNTVLTEGFLMYLLESPSVKNNLLRISSGGTAKGVSQKTLSSLTVKIPTSLKEQERINFVFYSLDSLITLHQRKLNKLKKLKSAYLTEMFPDEGEHKPKRRFAGFTDDWVQRKLGDISKTKRGLTYKPSNIDNTGIHVLRSSNIKEDTFVISDNDVFVKESAVNIPFVKNGDILITAANGSTNLVGKHAIIRDIPKNSAVHGGFMLITTSKEYEFLNASMSSNWYKKFIKKYVAGGNGAIGNLRKNDLDNQKIYVPKKDEQEKIGNFFKMLDSLITLHQRKLERLKQLKKFLLQNMFI